jgi:hypothetical protein
MALSDEERLRRWRLVLGSDAQDTVNVPLTGEELGIDSTLDMLYAGERSAGLESSRPNVNRWLGDIRKYFPTQVVCVMQRDALRRLNLTQMLLEPELLAAVEPDVHLVGTLLSLSKVIPQRTRETARQVVRKLVDDLMRRLRNRTTAAVRGALNRATRTHRPRPAEIDWHRTIRANLRHYLPEQHTLVPERLIGFGHKRASLRDIILCVDQSGSMAASVVYAGVFGAVLASLPAVNTRMVVFDTSVVDLSDHLADPVELLFGTQLGGGTDINQALGYCETQVIRPTQTILVLITDLFEGGDVSQMLRRIAHLIQRGVKVICLLALNDQGAPSFHETHAAHLAALGAPAFACTPDLFPDLLAAALANQDISTWAARHDIATARAGAG